MGDRASSQLKHVELGSTISQMIANIRRHKWEQQQQLDVQGAQQPIYAPVMCCLLKAQRLGQCIAINAQLISFLSGLCASVSLLHGPLQWSLLTHLAMHPPTLFV